MKVKRKNNFTLDNGCAKCKNEIKKEEQIFFEVDYLQYKI